MGGNYLFSSWNSNGIIYACAPVQSDYNFHHTFILWEILWINGKESTSCKLYLCSLTKFDEAKSWIYQVRYNLFYCVAQLLA